MLTSNTRMVQMCAFFFAHKHTDTLFFFSIHAGRHTLMATGSFSSIYGLEMGVELCLVELSSTILSHIGLTSNTSDKPILFLPTESSPCPKITLLSLGSQQRRMVSRVLIPAFGINSMLEKANKAIWQELISCHFKNTQNACGMPFGFIFYLSLLERHGYAHVLPSEYLGGKVFSANALPFATHRTTPLPFRPGRE